MAMRTRALASLTLAVALGAGIATAAAAGGLTTLAQHVGISSHQETTNGTASGPAAHPTNHGSFVSRAAHTCAHGAHGVHGKCVSKVATSSSGKP